MFDLAGSAVPVSRAARRTSELWGRRSGRAATERRWASIPAGGPCAGVNHHWDPLFASRSLSRAGVPPRGRTREMELN